MTKKVADTKGFAITLKINLYPLMVVDREPILTNEGIVTHKTVPLEMIILQGHKETIQFNIVHMDNHVCILRMLWLKQHNLYIN
jgi:hypothetical protein